MSIPQIRQQRTYDSGVALFNKHAYYYRSAVTAPAKYEFFGNGLGGAVTLATTNLEDNGKTPVGTQFDMRQIKMTVFNSAAAGAPVDAAWAHALLRCLSKSLLTVNIIGYQDVGQFPLASFLTPIAMVSDAQSSVLGIVAPVAIELGDMYITLSEQVKFSLTIDTSASGVTLADTDIVLSLHGERFRNL